MVDPVVAWIARLALAGVFAAAAWHKLRDLPAFAAAVAAHRLVPEALSAPLACAFAAIEIAIAGALLWPATASVAGAAAAALLAVYSAAIAINLARGRAIDCGCSARPKPITRGLLARNTLLAAGALVAALPIGTASEIDMTDALWISNALLWGLVVVLAGIVAALARQLGVLHERLAPLGALAIARGPEPGEQAPVLLAPTLAGAALSLGGADAAGQRTLLFFASPTCPICKTLLPTVRRAVASERDVRLVLASDGDPREHAAFARAHALDPASYVLSREVGLRYEVAKLPYAVLIDAAGIVRAKGLVNTREHVESLFEAQRLGAPTIQAHLAHHPEGALP